jgi:hypothetical protein
MEWIYVFAVIQVLLTAIAAFGGSYLKEKGKNRAIREDLDKVTKAIQEIELQFKKDYFSHTIKTEAKFSALSGINERLQRMAKAVTNTHPLGKDYGDLERISGSLDKVWEIKEEIINLMASNKLIMSEALVAEIERLNFKVLWLNTIFYRWRQLSEDGRYDRQILTDQKADVGGTAASLLKDVEKVYELLKLETTNM